MSAGDIQILERRYAEEETVMKQARAELEAQQARGFKPGLDRSPGAYRQNIDSKQRRIRSMKEYLGSIDRKLDVRRKAAATAARRGSSYNAELKRLRQEGHAAEKARLPAQTQVASVPQPLASSSPAQTPSIQPLKGTRGLTFVNRAGEPTTRYTAVTERQGNQETTTLYARDVRENYFDFGTGKKVTIQRELPGELSGSPLLTSTIENVSGFGPKVETRVVERREPSLFSTGQEVRETTVTPRTKAQAQILTASRERPLGRGAPVVATVRESEIIPSRIDQRLAPKTKGSFTGAVLLKAGSYGERLSAWAEPRLEASQAQSRARGASIKRDQFSGKEFFSETSFFDAEPWKQERYKEVAGLGGFLQGGSEVSLSQPSKFIIGGTIGAAYVLASKGAGSGAASITGTSLGAQAGRQVLLRTSQLATVGGIAATGIYALDVSKRVQDAPGPTARGRVLGEEAPGLLGVFVGAKATSSVIAGVQQGRAAFTARGVVGRPLTQAGVRGLEVVGRGAESDIIVKGRELRGVALREGAVSDSFGIRGVQEQSPIFGREQTFPLGEAPKTSPYYRAVGGGSRTLRTPVLERVDLFEAERIVTGGVAARAASVRVSGYDYPDLNSGATGIRGTFKGEAELYFGPVKGGIVRSATGRGLAPDTPFYREFQSELAFQRLLAEVEIIEMSPPARSPWLPKKIPKGSKLGRFQGRPRISSPETSLIGEGETIISPRRPSARSLGGPARAGASEPGYEFEVGGQRMKLKYDTWELETKAPEVTSQGTSQGGPFIVEGITFEGLGKVKKGGLDFGVDLGASTFSVIGGLSGPGAKSAFGFGVDLGQGVSSRTASLSGVDFTIGSAQRQGQVVRQLSGLDVIQRQGTDTIQDTFFDDPVMPVQGTPTGRDYGFDDPQTPRPPPDITEFPFGGFALPFGGGRGRGPRARVSKASFRGRYNPSIAAKVFSIRGTRSQGLRAARTGVSVRPLI